MKLTKTQSVFLAVIIPLTAITALSSIIAIKETYANKVYEAAANEAKTDREILNSKIETLNEVNSMYQTSYKTGFSNCIKTNSELTCSKRYKQIANHFSNEYDTKLLKILADQSGIALSEHFATGRITAVSNTLEYDDEIAGLVRYYSSIVSQDIQDLNNNKDEVVSIGGKFAELGLKAQTSHSTESIDIEKLSSLFKNKNSNEKLLLADLLDVAERAEANGGYTFKNKREVVSAVTNYGKSEMIKDHGIYKDHQALKTYKGIMERLDLEEAQKGAFGVGKAPALMDTVVDSGKALFDTASTTSNGSNVKELSNEELSKLMTTYNTAFKSVALDLTPIDKETGGKN